MVKRPGVSGTVTPSCSGVLALTLFVLRPRPAVAARAMVAVEAEVLMSKIWYISTLVFFCAR